MFYQPTLLALVALAGFANAQVSDDFESGWDETKWPIYAPDCNQGGSVTLDNTVAHSGSSSMKVVGGSGGFCGHIFFGTTAVPTGGDIYVRAWVKASTALTASHVSFITMTDSGLGANKHLRIGGQSEILMFNRETDDATLPALSPQGIAASKALPTDGFQCLEYHLGTDGTIETWLNSESIAGLQAGPNANNSNADQWESAGYKPAITGIYFGWESYSGDINTFWYDDISIGSSRVGCGATDNSGQTTTSVSEAPKTTLATSTKAASTPAGVTTTSKASETIPTTSVETSEPSTSVPQSAVLSSTATPSSTVPDSTTSTSTSASSTPTRKCSKNKKRRNHYK
ncbi:unnamed protein product [Clonostachys rhizophaga]|uniref:Cip1-like core domain-containing protein n=1 Tax=Clonostachys rhizophaga TaxID=160324 RepID=A0A9N9YUH8_9HYPO|nr:unnamed protein product [Clonostachys rhizophaga]